MKAASSTFGLNLGEGFGRALIYDPRVILLRPLMPVIGLVGVTTSAIYGAVAGLSAEPEGRPSESDDVMAKASEFPWPVGTRMEETG